MSISYLSDNTRKTRRSLLAASLIAYAISELGLTLTEVQVFGSKFEFQNYGAIPSVLILVVLYFLVTFAVYSLSEYAHAYKIAGEELLERHKRGEPTTPEEIKFSLGKLEEEVEDLRSVRHRGVEPEVSIKAFEDMMSKDLQDRYDEHQKLQRQYEIAMDILHRRPILARISWKGFRTFIEMALPVLLALYAIGHLWFFTEITNPALNGNVETANMVQPDSNAVVTETPIIVDTSDTISDD